MDMSLILGIDPGLNITGYGVVRVHSPQEMEVIEAGVVRGGDSRRPIGQRLAALRDGVGEVLRSYPPSAMAVEQLYSHYERPRTAILMGHARGVLCLAATDAGVPVHHYSATQVKKTLTGSGRASKHQVQQAVARFLELPGIPEPHDVADALAIAVCHYYLYQSRPEIPA